ncbi:LytR/AlgR family response regulator transcription factor [Polaribacter ponticola]|uniref:Response regulator transcription factor n=1 Tax=Polaribacter ponticola TaxID=2978475 RepID=A0ABT5S6H3_9FLAO|nr:response regulator transcription factor [Polaribacter sp. MSW5]MDD7913703.1 response regulator transcription factor [Polaribacter sp. MSW5]
MKTRCLIVDDEPLAIRLIEKHISQIDSLEVVATCNSALKAFEIVNTQEIDLMFLDIKMPNLTGIDFLKSLKNPPKTIFTTAYRDYALESYELETVDYLLKPVTFERFVKAIDKFFWQNTSKVAPVQRETITTDYILIKSGNKHHKVNLADIVYIESFKDYIKVHLENNTSIVSKYKLGEMELELSTYQFLRIHRSYIINTSKITAFSSNDIDVNSLEIPIGASYKEKVILHLEKIKHI